MNKAQRAVRKICKGSCTAAARKTQEETLTVVVIQGESIMKKLDEERRMLVEKNIGLAHKIAWDYRNCPLEMEEIDAVALYGLVKAGSAFDESGKCKFATFADTVIRNEILMEIRRSKRIPCISLDEEIIRTVYDGTSCAMMNLLRYEEPGFERVEQYDLIPALIEMANLNMKERQAVLLAVCQGRKQKEVSGQMKISQSLVSRYVRRGINKIKRGWPF